MIIDANTVSRLDNKDPEVVIIGAGTAGLVSAKQILSIRPETRLTILESGGLSNSHNANHLDTDNSINDRIKFSALSYPILFSILGIIFYNNFYILDWWIMIIVFFFCYFLCTLIVYFQNIKNFIKNTKIKI